MNSLASLFFPFTNLERAVVFTWQTAFCKYIQLVLINIIRIYNSWIYFLWYRHQSQLIIWSCKHLTDSKQRTQRILAQPVVLDHRVHALFSSCDDSFPGAPCYLWTKVKYNLNLTFSNILIPNFWFQKDRDGNWYTRRKTADPSGYYRWL